MEISQFISFILGRLQVIAVQNYIKIYLNVMLRYFVYAFCYAWPGVSRFVNMLLTT